MSRPSLRLDLRPTWTAGPNPHVAAFAGAGAGRGRGVARPFAGEARGTKGSPAYRAHMYHTKVPPEAIEPYVEHYTRPGDTVLDPFCGSGMTGVAALRLGRRALLSDLSPVATFLAYNQCAPADPEVLRAALREVIGSVRAELEPLYRARCPRCGGAATIRYTIWSDLFRCPACDAEYALWDAAIDGGRRVRGRYPCPHCGAPVVKRLRDRTGARPVAMRLRCPRGCEVREAPVQPTAADVPRTGWYPADAIPAGLDELSRVHRSGVRTVADLFTPRNRAAVAALWDRARRLEPAPLRARALFAVTAIMVRASRLIKYIPSRRMAPGPILGTMYVPSFSAEINVLDMFGRRIGAVCRAAGDLRPRRGPEALADLCVSTQSATDLSAIPDGSIDYVFTDPPFGHNILYSELNFLWESWLGWRTDPGREAVVSKSQGKGVAEYGHLMAAAFGEMQRVLKPGGWMTLVFHNTRADVWAAIQRGVADAGFRIEAIQTLDKSHETFKQVTAVGAVGYDVVVNGRKPPAGRRRPAARRATRAARPVAILRRLLAEAPERRCKERTARHLHARLTGELVRAGSAVTLDYRDVLELLGAHFAAEGEYWSLCRTRRQTR